MEEIKSTLTKSSPVQENISLDADTQEDGALGTDVAPEVQTEAGANPQASHAAPSDEKTPQKKTTHPTAQKKSAKSGKNPPKKRKKKSTARMLADFVIKLAVIALAVWLVLTFVIGVTIHYGNSMHPAIEDGDLVVSFRLQSPYINSAVMYRHDGKECVGRVIGLPGNEIDIKDNGAITVNGITPSEEVFYPTYPAENSPITYPYTVEEGKVFILNDFRSDTYDSRTFGTVDMSDVHGTLLLTLRRREF